MPSSVPDVVFGPGEFAILQSVYDALLERIAWERPICEDERLHIAHVLFAYGKLGILDPEELTALTIAELPQHADSKH
jgi:hypothetical protein